MNDDSAFFWLFFNLLSSIALGFYSMQEMACVSFNKIRLEYYVKKGMQRAVWLNYLLEKPSRLFGTTLIGVNVAMFVGSECARRSYEALGLPPFIAPLTQVAFIIIFAELAPMFAARRYSEQVALKGALLLYFSARLLTPVLWFINLITNFLDFLTGVKSGERQFVLNKEELQQLLDDQDEEGVQEPGEETGAVARNIFNLHSGEAKEVMQPLSTIPSLPSKATVKQLRELLKRVPASFIPIYHRNPTHIVGIATPRDFLRIPDHRRIGEHANPPWFLTDRTPLMQMIKEFRRSQKNVAIVLNDEGVAMGMITRSDLTKVIFGTIDPEEVSPPPFVVIDRTLPANMTVDEFNRQFDLKLDADPSLTLAELMTTHLGHHPENGESLYLDPFELKVKETSLTGIRTISIETHL